jgi:hypothetical protein
MMSAGGSHTSKHYECGSCGYSRFHYRGEFADGTPGDKTRVCADCGHIEETFTLNHSYDDDNGQEIPRGTVVKKVGEPWIVKHGPQMIRVHTLSGFDLEVMTADLDQD